MSYDVSAGNVTPSKKKPGKINTVATGYYKVQKGSTRPTATRPTVHGPRPVSEYPSAIDAPLRIAAQRKIAAYQQQYADNQNISFLPAIVSTSTRIHGEFLRLLFLQAHRETEAHFTDIGMSSQHINTEALRFKQLHSTTA
jgi:hypothetical protein